ncbi:MAG TPA: hypothetical protein VK131_03700 [Candidatus Acidoferrales bacterium]|nr:hypothetical protein [Candidatus Acidoferrales bacterium]
MRRVLHYRLHGLPPERQEGVRSQFSAIGSARPWKSGPPWIASQSSRDLFEMEFFRHVQAAEGADVTAAGFLKMAGDETDALILSIFLRDLSSEHRIRVVLRDEEHPLLKLRYLEFRSGLLPSGNSLEDMLARRPVIKKVEDQPIHFYPPSYRVHSQAPAGPVEWGYALCGLRAFAPTLLEAEQEALKILRGLRHLGR